MMGTCDCVCVCVCVQNETESKGGGRMEKRRQCKRLQRNNGWRCESVQRL